jgi:FtsH-binding integral membrane protein
VNYQDFIKPELLILIPTLLFVGAGIKRSNIKDNYIPLILGAVGVVFAGVYVFASEPVNGTQGIATAIFTAFTQGVLCAGAAVYANQIYKQAEKARED